MTEIRITGGVDTLYRVWIEDDVHLETDDMEEAQTEALELRANRTVEARVERIERMLAILVCTTPTIPVALQVEAFNNLPLEIRRDLQETVAGA